MKIYYVLSGIFLGAILGLSVDVLICTIVYGNDFITAQFVAMLYLLFCLPTGMAAGAILALLAFKQLALAKTVGISVQKSKWQYKGPIFATLIFAVASFTTAAIVGHPPSDNQLIRNFYEHQSKFSKIERLVQSDGETRSMSGPQVTLCDQLCRSFGADSCNVIASENFEMEVFCAGRSLAASEQKGYAYMKQPPDFLTTDLDTFPDGNYEDEYRHIEGNWYLYFRHCP